jgi:hypothetical protein
MEPGIAIRPEQPIASGRRFLVSRLPGKPRLSDLAELAAGKLPFEERAASAGFGNAAPCTAIRHQDPARETAGRSQILDCQALC